MRINPFLLIGVAVAAAVWYSQTTTAMRSHLKQVWPAFTSQFDLMTDAEVKTIYNFSKNYYEQGKSVPTGSPLQLEIASVADKYHIFS